MRNNVVAPSVGESITEVSILKWAKNHGDAVKPGDMLLEIESDKATVEIVAEHSGTLQIVKPAGERIPIGEVVGFIDDTIPASAGAPAMAMPPVPGAPKAPPAMPPVPGAPTVAPPSAPPAAAPTAPPSAPPSMAPPMPPPGAPPSFAPPPPLPSGPAAPSAAAPVSMAAASAAPAPGLSPAVRRVAASTGVDPSTIAGTGKDGRVTKGDVLGATPRTAPATTPSAPSFGTVAAGAPSYAPPASPAAPSAPVTPALKMPATDKPGDRRVPMSMLRSKIAERLVHAQQTAAILTTFNEVDMSAVMKLRSEQKDAFKTKNGVNLSFMSFFTKASIAALKAIPEVNATIDGRDTVYHDYYDVGIAVGTERGLVVPVIRGADKMSFVELEKKIAEFAMKGRDGKLTMADLTGGTFTISNGGTYGSLMSTPILNPPQSGILGMHKIMDRPIAVNGKVEIRPMMYVALSYDHRLIDGKGAVTWLVTLKDHLENPEKLGFSL